MLQPTVREISMIKQERAALPAQCHVHSQLSSVGKMVKPHAVCVPFPAQGHITPMLKLAKLLHHKGFYITFVNTEYNHRRLLRSRGPDSLNGLDDFRFETIPDGLPPSDCDVTQHVPYLCDSTAKNCLVPFRELVNKLNSRPNEPKISCIVSDGAMSFTLDVAEELQVPEVLFWMTAACGFMGFLHYQQLITRGITPFKDESYFTNGYLGTTIDWIPGMKDIRLMDLPSFIRTTDPNDIMLNFCNREAQRASKASAIIVNTFHDLEREVLDGMASILEPRVYTIGPLPILTNKLLRESSLHSMGSNLWKEDTSCLEWLNTKDPNSVVYVNYGSITVMTPEQLVEFAWGLANSNYSFLWVIRPDLVMGDSAILPPEYAEVIKERGLLLSWVPQEQVLAHPAVEVFLTHCGWNSTLESICCGVPMICWPFFAEQQTNCRYICREWGIGMEIDSNVKRNEVEGMIREVMLGEKGKELKRRAFEWRAKSEKATKEGGSSTMNLDNLLKEVLLS